MFYFKKMLFLFDKHSMIFMSPTAVHRLRINSTAQEDIDIYINILYNLYLKFFHLSRLLTLVEIFSQHHVASLKCFQGIAVIAGEPVSFLDN